MEAPDDLIEECLSWDLCVGVTVENNVVFFQRPFDEKRFVTCYDRYGNRFKQWLPVENVVCMGEVASDHLTTSSIPTPNILTGRSLPIGKFLDMCDGSTTFLLPYIRRYVQPTPADVRKMVEETLPKILRDGKVFNVKKNHHQRTVDDDGFTIV